MSPIGGRWHGGRHVTERTVRVVGRLRDVRSWSAPVPGFVAVPTWVRPSIDAVYASDGWGVAYAAIRFRRFELSTGRELASIRTATAVRCLAGPGETGDLLVATDSRLLRLDALTLGEAERWTTRMPRWTDHLAVRGRVAVASNWHRPGISLVDLDSGRVRRRPTPAMTMVLDAPGDPLLVGGAEGFLATVEPATGVVRSIADVPAAIDAAVESDGTTVWLTLGVRGVVTASSVAPGSPTRRLLHLAPGAAEERVGYRLPSAVSRVALATDGLWLWSRRDLLAVQLPPGSDAAVARAWQAPTDYEISSVDPDARVVVLLRTDARVSTSEIACHRLIG